MRKIMRAVGGFQQRHHLTCQTGEGREGIRFDHAKLLRRA
jgi:hypothetical protein